MIKLYITKKEEMQMSKVETLVAILQGKAIVLVKRDDNKADVLLGKEVNKQFAINSMVGAVKALML
jgi:hypothetical protein